MFQDKGIYRRVGKSYRKIKKKAQTFSSSSFSVLNLVANFFHDFTFAPIELVAFVFDSSLQAVCQMYKSMCFQ